MSKRPAPKSDSTAESHDDSGSFAFAPGEPEEPVTPEALDASLSLADTARPRAVGADPYNRTSTNAANRSRNNKNRSLDDMRELSKAIESAPTWTPPDIKKTAALCQRIAALSVQLELAVAELGELSSAASDPADRKAGDVKKQLVRAANYLEEALDCLVPPDTSS